MDGALAPCDLILLPAFWGDFASLSQRHPQIIDWLRLCHAQGSALCGEATGVFWMAEAGLLDGEKLDFALYVAGVIRRPNALTPPTREDFDAVMHANVLGAMQAIPQVAPLVADAHGVFAFLSSSMSQIGSVPGSDAWLYRTSKAALNMAVAAAQHSYLDATLVTIDPGWVQTDLGGDSAPLTVEASVRGMRETLAGLTPADQGCLLHHDGRRAAHW